MPNLIQKFTQAKSKSSFIVRYLAHKLDVDLTYDVNAPEDDPHSFQRHLLQGPHVLASDVIALRDNAGKHWVTHVSDMIIGQAMRLTGDYDGDAVSGVMGLFDTLGLPRPSGTFYDIGANIGTHTVQAHTMGFARSVSVEPDPMNFDLLAANLALQGIHSNAETIHGALSDKVGVMKLERSNDNYGDHRVVSEDTPQVDRMDSDAGRTEIEVEVRTFDDVIAQSAAPLDATALVWMDVQGHEGHVFKGAQRILDSGCPVVTEFWPYGLARANGLDLFMDAVNQFSRIISIRDSADGVAVEMTAEDLVTLYHDRLGAEDRGGHIHADILLIK
ncbi:FkbM family methyltransferase [uncultured Tateyamaria sp.]|uniref:FkbM family methyltransferase n=1 Tax=uncultured Tateyamaria sp. TaxID=455651 RepID=UPI002627C012|nr:FkbM family methyltransferase [uncultured Tateyamaria sp.]